MEIKFKDGHEIEFRKFGEIWLADSVIFKGDELRSLMEEFGLAKAKINQWFDENAPEEIREKYNARLPLWEEIKDLPFKDQIAYAEGRTDTISDYMLGDGDDTDTLICYAGYSYDCGWLSCDIDYIYVGSCPVRLCLEEK